MITNICDNYVWNNLLCILHSSLCLIFTTTMVKIALFLSFYTWESWGSKSLWNHLSRRHSSNWAGQVWAQESEFQTAAQYGLCYSLWIRAAQPASSEHPRCVAAMPDAASVRMREAWHLPLRSWPTGRWMSTHCGRFWLERCTDCQVHTEEKHHQWPTAGRKCPRRGSIRAKSSKSR